MRISRRSVGGGLYGSRRNERLKCSAVRRSPKRPVEWPIAAADCIPNAGAASATIGPRTRDRRCGDIERRTRHGLAAWGLIGPTRPTRLQPARCADVAWHVTLRILPSQRRPPRPLQQARPSALRLVVSPTKSIHQSPEQCRRLACRYRLGSPCAARPAFIDREPPHEKRNADQRPAT